MPAHKIAFLRLSQSGLVARGQLWMTMLPVIGIVIVAVAARAWLLFGTDYVPGVNGAYYLVQARSLMERAVLGIPDMPLTFHLHAALAWLLIKVGGMGQADAILWSVKLCDAVLPPLVAWPVFVLVRRWTQARGQGDGVPLAAAALACFAWPWLRMVGDLQKNSLALVWLALLAMALVLWKYDPARIHRLITALTHPVEFSDDGLQGPMPPHGRMNPLRWLPYLGFAAAVLPGLGVAWHRRKHLPEADVALVTGAALTVLVITGPWFGMDKAMRFYLIALLPAILVGAFGVLQVPSPWVRWNLTVFVLIIGIGSTLTTLRRGGSVILSNAAMAELRSLARYVAQSDHTLISAQHGAEWWTAWFLHTHIAHAYALVPSDWQRYDCVCFLEIKSGLQMPFTPGGGGPPGAGPRGIHPPERRRSDAMPPRPAMGANPMMAALIPADAEVLHDGVCLKFARIAKPPNAIQINDQPP